MLDIMWLSNGGSTAVVDICSLG